MKYTSVFIIAFILFSLQGGAQITIENYNYLTPATETTTLQTSINSNVKLPSTGPDQSWNYSNLTDTVFTTAIDYMPPASSLFSHATRYYIDSFNFDAFYLYIKQYQLNDTSSFSDYGYSVDSQYFDLTYYTGNKGDFLAFLSQNQFKHGEYYIKYPATANSAWSSSTGSALNFILNIPSYGYKNTPGKRVRNTTVKDSVVGWGNMIVPFSHDGSFVASQSCGVLMVRETVIASDSFYLNGQPANPILLKSLGLTNPTISPTFYYLFYRAGNSVPLITFYMDSSFKMVQYESYDVNHLTENGIGPNDNPSFSASIYPNPVNTSTINLTFYNPGNDQRSINITNCLGQVMQTMPLNETYGQVKVQVNLPPTLTNGLYFYTISGSKGGMTSGKFILSR